MKLLNLLVYTFRGLESVIVMTESMVAGRQARALGKYPRAHILRQTQEGQRERETERGREREAERERQRQRDTETERQIGNG